MALALTGCGAGAAPAPTTSAAPASSTPKSDELTPLVGSVPFAPITFAGSDGANHLVYELSVTNFTAAPMTIDRLQVDDGTDRVVGDLDAAAVRGRLQPAGSRDNTDRLAAAGVDRRTLPVLSAPLAGERYIAADGCCDAVRHTRALLPINGQTFVAQRYAIDYEQADEQNRIYTGDARDPKNYEIFGKEVPHRPCRSDDPRPEHRDVHALTRASGPQMLSRR